MSVGARHVPINGEILEAKDIQQADGTSQRFGLVGRRLVDGRVDLLYDPHKQTPIDTLYTHTHTDRQTDDVSVWERQRGRVKRTESCTQTIR